MTIMDCTQDAFYGEEKKKELIDDLIGVINKVSICYNYSGVLEICSDCFDFSFAIECTSF